MDLNTLLAHHIVMGDLSHLSMDMLHLQALSPFDHQVAMQQPRTVPWQGTKLILAMDPLTKVNAEMCLLRSLTLHMEPPR
jgi:hypothetical protein